MVSPLAIIGAVGCAIVGISITPYAIGFGTAGIAANSLAALIQSSIGNVVAGSLFATLTSLSMTGTFTTTAAVGALLGAGGFSGYLVQNFSPQKDNKLINTVFEKEDNPEIIVKLLEARTPSQRNKLNLNNNDIIKKMPDNLKEHVKNLLMETNEIPINTRNVRHILSQFNYETFKEYCEDKFVEEKEIKIINEIIDNNDNPLLIVRLLNYRNKKQISKIKKLESKIKRYMKGSSEYEYVKSLLQISNIKKLESKIKRYMKGSSEYEYVKSLLQISKIKKLESKIKRYMKGSSEYE